MRGGWGAERRGGGVGGGVTEGYVQYMGVGCCEFAGGQGSG
jgi:hypothetical protein